MHKSSAFIFVLVLLSAALGGTAGAQDSGACPALVNRALSHVGNNCAGMDRNSVCYGFEDISAVFTDASQLNQPADRAGLLNLASLQTMPFDSVNEKWGISVLNAQANLPNTLPGQSVRILLLGDVRIEEETEPSQALILPEEAIEVTAKAGTLEIYAAPIDFGVISLNIVDRADTGERLLADGLSPTGQWVRVTFEFATEYGKSATAWVRREDLAENAALDSLPTIGPGSYTPMQAFYFTTGVGQAICDELPPSGMLVQGPEEYEVIIRANSAEIRINSTILLQTSANGDMMRLTPLSGIARVNPGTEEELIVPAGYSATVCLDGPYNLGVADDQNDYVIGVGCAWSLAGGLTQEYLGSLNSLENVPGNILNYPIPIPEQICASGIGGPRCEYRYRNPDFPNKLARLCEAGLIPADICQTVAPGVVASEEGEACEAAANQATAGVGNNCANLDWDAVCYGYQSMVASFANVEGLLQPADRASARNFIAASTEGFDALLDQWGIFAMNTRADLPNTFREGSVRSVLFGEGQIENDVRYNAALLLPDDPVEVTMAGATAQIYSFPTEFVLADAQVIGQAGPAATFSADGISASGEWVRIAFAYETDYGFLQTAWIQRDALDDNPDLDELPVIGMDSLTPMQSFYFAVSSAVPQCGATPASAQLAYLLIQSPEDVEITQTINSADTRINGTVLLQAFPLRRLMRLTTLTGIARVQPGTGDEILIPAGYSAITCMDGPFNRGADGAQNDYVAGDHCEWHLSGRIAQEAFTSMGAEETPNSLLNYPVYIPQLVCDEEGCEYKDTNPVYGQRLAHLCTEELLPQSICRFVGP